MGLHYLERNRERQFTTRIADYIVDDACVGICLGKGRGTPLVFVECRAHFLDLAMFQLTQLSLLSILLNGVWCRFIYML